VKLNSLIELLCNEGGTKREPLGTPAGRRLVPKLDLQPQVLSKSYPARQAPDFTTIGKKRPKHNKKSEDTCAPTTSSLIYCSADGLPCMKTTSELRRNALLASRINNSRPIEEASQLGVIGAVMHQSLVACVTMTLTKTMLQAQLLEQQRQVHSVTTITNQPCRHTDASKRDSRAHYS